MGSQISACLPWINPHRKVRNVASAPDGGVCRSLRVTVFDILFELIDMRSFSNLWFWIMLGVQWWMNSHRILGVPFDMILRAKRQGGAAQQALEDLARVHVNRLLYIVHVSGAWIAGIGAFLLTGMAVAGFWYGAEFAQAVFCLMFPQMVSIILAVQAAHHIADGEHGGEALQARLIKLRLAVQAVGMVSILLTAVWGMYQNLNVSVLH